MRKSVDWSNEFEDGDYHLYARGPDASALTWSADVPIRVQAMVRAADTLFVAGPDAESVRQTEPAAGQGTLLLAYSARDGTQLASYPLSAPPVFDGMAAARGQLILTLLDGSVVCLGGK